MNKKLNIGIVTWLSFDNYGTYLQAYALNKKIQMLGYDVTTIECYNYKKTDCFLKKYIMKCYRFFKHIILKVLGSNKIIPYDMELSRHNLFVQFKKDYIPYQSLINNDENKQKLNFTYDFFVSGSDQIWNPNYLQPSFFLDFVSDKKKKIAYAPSFGTNVIDNEKVKQSIRNYLIQFNKLSIREKTGREIIKELLGKDVPVLIDPTMLLTKEDWMSIENTIPKKLPDEFILCYFLGNNEIYWKNIYIISREYKIPIVLLPIYYKDFFRPAYKLSTIGPAEFIYLIEKAKYVCTDSFHGTIFSLIFEKQFTTFYRFSEKQNNNQNTRIINILEDFELENRIFDDGNLEKQFITEINYYNIKKHIDELRKESELFLNTSFTGKTYE